MTSKEIFEKIEGYWLEYSDNHHKFVTKGNKQAGVRARKALASLKGLITEYRQATILETKQLK